MIEGPLHEPGERLRTLCTDRFTDRFNERRVQLENVECAAINVQCLNLQYSTCAPTWKLNVERWAFGAYLRYRVACLLETDQHIPQTAAGLSLSAAMVFQAVVLHPRRDSGSGGAFCNSFLFQRRLRSKSAGQRVRHEQARSNGISQCDSRSQRENLWPNLRREPRDSPVREVGSRSDQRRHCRRGRKILRTPRLRFAGNHSCSAQECDRRPCPPGRQHYHATIGAQQFLAQRKNIPPKAPGDFSGQAHRRQFQQTENPRAISEPDLFRRRHVRSRSSGSRVLWQVCARYDAGGMRDAGRSDKEPKQTVAVV